MRRLERLQWCSGRCESPARTVPHDGGAMSVD